MRGHLKTNDFIVFFTIFLGIGNTNSSDGKPFAPEKYYVNVGTNYGNLTGGVIHFVKKVFVHPMYKGGGDNHYFHDVGMLQLTEDIKLNDRARVVRLAKPTNKPKVGDSMTISGWGTNPEHPDDNRLYQVVLKVISAKQCTQELAGGTVEEVEQHQICAKAEGKNQCKGDSGGM